MGWWSDLKDAVSDVAEDVGDAASDAANAVGEAVSDAAETIGNAFEDSIGAVFGNVPILNDAVHWVGGVISGWADFAGAIAKGAWGIVGGFIGGWIKILGGIASLNPDLIAEGLRDITTSFVGGWIVIIGKFISLVQTITWIQALERRLTKEEVSLLRRVFHRSIALYNVRIVEGRAGVFGINSRPFTLGNTIYMKDVDVATEPEQLVHECVHVWQYQHLGSRYTTEALGAQQYYGKELAYDWGAEIARGNDDWVEFNKEAQAEFFEDIYLKGMLVIGNMTQTGDGAFYDANGSRSIGLFEIGGVDHTARANEAVRIVRGERSLRPSTFL